MVDQPNVQLGWSLDNHTSPRLDDNNGCHAKGLGGSVPGETHKGTWDTAGIQFSSHKCFRTESKKSCTPNQRQLHVHLTMDNRTAVAYLLKMGAGGTRSPPLLAIAQELWEYALNKQMTLTAEYLPGELNHEADWQSRHFRDSSNWKLNPTVLHALDHLWGPLAIDLFADRMNIQLQTYISWFLDPWDMGQMHFRSLGQT